MGGRVGLCQHGAVEDERGAFGSELVFEESVTSFEFGVSDEGTLTLTDCTLSESDDEASLTGYFEGDEGYGALELSMASDGRSFSGMLTWDEDGSIETWRGRRVSEGSYGEAAPTNVRWLHESLLGRSGARLSLGRSAEALEDGEADDAEKVHQPRRRRHLLAQRTREHRIHAGDRV